ncbi:inverted formin-2-like [Ptychodera flava]|uniref:inverted formin-2-like n=1 Tax=Ptychodera flava TaxID=63121 RepID=UPI00396A38DA
MVFEILSALSVYSMDGCKMAIDALEYYKKEKNQVHRFSIVIDELKASENLTYSTTLIAFINSLLISTDDSEERHRLRNEFIGLGFLDIIGPYKQQDDSFMVTQLSVFYKLKSDDDNKRALSEKLHFDKLFDVFRAVYIKVSNSPQEVALLSIMQYFQRLDPDSPESDAIWKTTEKFLRHATIRKNAEQIEKLLNIDLIQEETDYTMNGEEKGSESLTCSELQDSPQLKIVSVFQLQSSSLTESDSATSPNFQSFQNTNQIISDQEDDQESDTVDGDERSDTVAKTEDFKFSTPNRSTIVSPPLSSSSNRATTFQLRSLPSKTFGGIIQKRKDEYDVLKYRTSNSSTTSIPLTRYRPLRISSPSPSNLASRSQTSFPTSETPKPKSPGSVIATPPRPPPPPPSTGIPSTQSSAPPSGTSPPPPSPHLATAPLSSGAILPSSPGAKIPEVKLKTLHSTKVKPEKIASRSQTSFPASETLKPKSPGSVIAPPPRPPPPPPSTGIPSTQSSAPPSGTSPLPQPPTLATAPLSSGAIILPSSPGAKVPEVELKVSHSTKVKPQKVASTRQTSFPTSETSKPKSPGSLVAPSPSPPPPPPSTGIPSTQSSAPPSGTSPPPPPPPMGTAPLSSGAILPSSPGAKVPKIKLKVLHWTKVKPQKVAETAKNIWRRISVDNPSTDVLPEYDDLEELFSLKRSATGKFISGKTKQEVNLLSDSRKLNVNIFLVQFKMKGKGIIDKIETGDGSTLGEERLRTLKRLLPNESEIEDLMSFSGDEDKLNTTEQFFLELLKLKNYRLRIDCMLLKEEFGKTLSSLKTAFMLVITSVKCLMKSAALERFLKLVLVTGNYMNYYHRYAGNANGFKMSSLLKLKETLSNKSRLTLLHHLVKVFDQKSHQQLTQLLDDFKTVSKASRYSLTDLKTEVRELSKRLDKMEQEVNMAEEDIKMQMKDFLPKASKEFAVLQSLVQEIDQLVVKLSSYLCEDETTFQLEELISTIDEFSQCVQQCRQENEILNVEEQTMKEEEPRKLKVKRKYDDKEQNYNSETESQNREVCLNDLLEEIAKGFTKRRQRQKRFKAPIEFKDRDLQ